MNSIINTAVGMNKNKMLRDLCWLTNISLLLALSLLSACTESEPSLLIFAGSASQPALEEASNAFEKQTGVKVELNIGGSGTVLSQMILSKQGDIYFPGSSDFMEIAKQKDVIIEESEKTVAFLIPCINVQHGNPKKINSLSDLLHRDINIAFANPEYVCLGRFAVEIMINSFDPQQIDSLKANILNYTGSCSKTAAAISLKTVDAVIGWNVFESWDPERIENIQLTNSELVRIGYMPIAISKLSKNKKLAQLFIDYITRGKGKQIFENHNYHTTLESVFNLIGSKKPIGGIYELPEEWIIN